MPIINFIHIKMNVLLLTTGAPSRHLVEALKGHTFERHNPSDLYLYVSESMNGYDRIYNGSRDLSQPQRLRIKDYDAVISRLGSNLSFGATILQHLTENLGIYCPQNSDGLLIAQDKMKTVMRLSKEGIRVPMTVFAKNASHVEHLMKMLGGLPVIAKLLKGSQGLGVMICRDAEQTNTTLESFWGQPIDIMLQRFVDAQRKDVRAIVVGERVVVAMERTGKKDFRANISQGGSGRKIELTNDQKELCINAAKAVGLEFAGVDLMTDQDGKSYIIEVNGNPGTKLIDITGHNYFIDLVKHIESKVDKPKSEKVADTGKPGDTGKSTEASELSSLQEKEKAGSLNYNERARLFFFKNRN
ncbi:MAG: RimK family alpha-L-glutamate ligase [Bacteroidetes bacterium]|nr:RimK family alpha-L-glutamate ligase [Bacteroidota bacterium]